MVNKFPAREREQGRHEHFNACRRPWTSKPTSKPRAKTWNSCWKGTFLRYIFEIPVSYHIFLSRCWDKWEQKCLLNFYRLDFQMKGTIKHTWDATCWLQTGKKKDAVGGSCCKPCHFWFRASGAQVACLSEWVGFKDRSAPNLLCVFYASPFSAFTSPFVQWGSNCHLVLSWGCDRE